MALSDRTFLVTGATSGIGEFTCELLAKQRCTLLVHGRDPAKVEALARRLSRTGAVVKAYVADLSLMSEVRRLGEEIAKEVPATGRHTVDV